MHCTARAMAGKSQRFIVQMPLAETHTCEVVVTHLLSHATTAVRPVRTATLHWRRPQRAWTSLTRPCRRQKTLDRLPPPSAR